jgi:ABC-type nitrate/sulfonate/bicarbonate transport system permease component
VVRALAPGRVPRAGWAYTLVSLGGILALWAALGAVLPENLLPGPVPTLAALRQVVAAGVFRRALLATLGHLVAGTALAVGVGIVVGIVMGRVPVVAALLKDVVAVAQTVPGLIIVTLAIIVFKLTPAGIVSVGFFFGLPSVIVTVWQATRNVDPNLLEMARVYGHREVSVMRRVILPAIVPDVVTALRVCVGILWHVTLFAEFIMGQQGFGYQISLALASFEVADIFAWGLTVVVLMIVMEYGLLRPLERRLLAWKPRAATA